VRTTLESGAWIEHTPIQDLKGKHVRALARVAKPQLGGDILDEDGEVDLSAVMSRMDFGQFGQQRHDALWAIIIEAWSFDFEPPHLDGATGIITGGDALDEIPLDDYTEIDQVLAPYSRKLTAKASPKGATTSGSNGSSRARAGGSRRA
jgi:hypothetical protein